MVPGVETVDLEAGRVRPAREVDAVRVAAIDRLTSANPRSVDYHAASCRGSRGEQVIVYDWRGDVVGFVVMSAVVDEGSIHNIAVHPGHRKLGIGSALMAAAVTAMRRDGLHRCLLEVRESNAAARALYRRLGFRVDGRRPNYYPNETGREDALLMSLVL